MRTCVRWPIDIDRAKASVLHPNNKKSLASIKILEMGRCTFKNLIGVTKLSTCMSKSFHTGIIKKSIMVKATNKEAWKAISDISGLKKWVIHVEKCHIKPKRKKSGVGAVREIKFEDGSIVEEHVIAWSPFESFSYVAVSGLPLRAYIATISLSEKKGTKSAKSIQITWQSYINSKKMSQKEFAEFREFMGMFYQKSLRNLKLHIEKKH